MGASVHSPIGRLARPVTFDTGALIAVERADAAIRALLRVLFEEDLPILVPAPAIAEAWRGGGGRQARLAQFLNRGVRDGAIYVVALDYDVAKEVGILIGRAPMSVTDALVCRYALQTGGSVVTSDPADIGRLVPPDRIRVV